MKRKQRRKKATSSEFQKSVVLPSDAKHLIDVRRLIHDMWGKLGLARKEGRLVALAVDEALSAIIRHAQGMNRPGNINVELHINDVCFKVIIQDNTNALDFTSLSERDKKITLEKEKQYQLGVFLISTIMDEITYYYRKGFQNELQLTRFITR